MKSVMTHSFSQVPSVNIPRSTFDRSHGLKTTFDAGYLVPILADEALPGDTFNCRMTGFARMSTPIYPLMDNMRMETFFFAIPMRLLWSNFKKFMGEQETPSSSIDYVIPTQVSHGTTGINVGTFEDHIGIPTGVPDLEFSALYRRAYLMVINEWFRDQNLQNSNNIDTGDESGTVISGLPLIRRGKRHDYFTSCLPWPQKGDSIDIPLGTTAPVIGDPANGLTFNVAGSANNPVALTGTASSGNVGWDANSTATGNADYNGGLLADLTGATAATINQLRQAFQVQRLLERDARSGTRYVELIKSHFGVTSPDFRVQRPEYLGGGSSYVNISPIAQTAQDASAPMGTLAAMGTVSLKNHGFVKSFHEHCIILGLVNVRADLTYQQGLDRMFSRSTRYDFYWPVLSQIGEQAVLNKEIYAQGTAQDDEVFGYQERYGEYRYKQSKITGKFRSTAAGTLDPWHLSQEFTSLPTLGDTFIQDNPPIDRVIATPTEPHFIFDGYFNYRCARPMPLFGTPGNLDHF